MSSHHRARKRFGQHFLSDETILMDMRQAIAPEKQDHMVEIGPGMGVLTRYLVAEVATFEAIEIDRDLIKLLQEEFGHYDHFVLHTMDVLQTNWSQLANDLKLRVVGNLPYNISTPLIFSLFDAISVVHDMHFLLQKEVGERLAAPVGAHGYGRLSVMSQYYCDTELLFYVDPDAFTPPPKVNSVFLRMTPKPAAQLTVKDTKLFEKVVATAFNQRRKTLRNSLRPMLDEAGFEVLGIDLKKRAQDLTVDEYVRIANYLTQLS
ncbi:MAG: 16S rRNA (adenine(1518)-N(6)/adenine(1519)-N(6))-dimethyltransferase [Coxiella sp. (in: Bacteria)]|nr:MAG: 16S rRNA (adenine(1518)-N(6)/adenine(1519)-N(6))-dimethyltransferase [Coxiella sp. (in: g-proteobacteria)]